MKLKSPCEMIVWKVLPAIRARLVLELSKEGFSQREIAKKLGITEAAVSQYVNKKRAGSFKLNKKLDSSFRKAAGEISKSNTPLTTITESCIICKEIRHKGYLCEAHMASAKIPKSCRICIR